MDKKAELDKLHSRAFALRVPIYKVCLRAGVAPSTVSRWKTNPDMMTARPLGDMEKALDDIAAEKAANQ